MSDPSLASIAGPVGVQLVNTSPTFGATLVTVTTFLHPTSLPPRSLLYLLSAWLDVNLFLAFVPLESVMPTAHTFVPGLVAWTTVAGSIPEPLADNDVNSSIACRLDTENEFDAILVNRLHLALLKIILKAPPGTLQVGYLRRADHLVKLAHSLETRLGTGTATNERLSNATTWRIERFVQIVQAALSSRCVHGSLRGLRTALSRLPPTQLTGIVLETNKSLLT
ncbi:hypothetical protein BIW11_09485 [Tropilaelaps mercedesae]|uniref:Uncharacterized protein n=1 Tax=Tropilaelaps mercedesae TaxID=418985 RepID=A0A1V9XJZ3_9ACAR|nr:hypothetical protein BIW11_09485 [Tropilaelaps mercedesae]